MKALIVRLSSIGDVVHTLPTLAVLHRQGWDTGWLVEPASRVLLDENPALSQLAEAPPAKSFRAGGAWRTLRALRSARYDVALDLQGLWKSAAWARLSGARQVLGWERRARREPLSSVLLTRRAEWTIGGTHVIDKNLALLRPLGIEAVGARQFPLPHPADSVTLVDEGLSALGLFGDFALLNPGGGWPSKLWPPERFGQLAGLLQEAAGLRSIVTWGPGEEGLAERAAAASSGAAVRGFPTSLLDFVELARRARLVVAADTGPLHLACAVGAPVVALFGPTSPTRNGPFSPADVVVRHEPECAPCYSRTCLRHAGIMDEIEPAEVLQAATRRLERVRKQAAHAV